MKVRVLMLAVFAVESTMACLAHAADDWPMYRADAARSGHVDTSLPSSLELQWSYDSSTPSPAWPSSLRVTYDFAHQPIIADGAVVFGSTLDDSVSALDLATGQIRWRFFTGGPIRFAPAAWNDRVLVASDDGHLYALSLSDGKMLWKHQGGPNSRLCLGNKRMISRWPARGGPVVKDDIVYYSAGIWPSDGVYLHALDALSGHPVWTNDRTGRLRIPQPHGGAEADSGVAPQGYLLATDQKLLVPTGRAVPAAFNRNDGSLEYYLLQENGSIGGTRAALADRFVINGGCFLERETGKLAARAGRGVFSVLPDGILQFTGDRLLGYHWQEAETRDAKGNLKKYRGLKMFAEVEIAETEDEVRRASKVAESLPALGNLFRTRVVFKDADANVAKQTGLERTLSQSRPDVERLGGDVVPFQAAAYERTCELVTAGSNVICGSQNIVYVVDLEQQKIRWSHPVDGNAVGLAVADDSLLVATTKGQLYCFADAPRQTVVPNSTDHIESSLPSDDTAAAILARDILRESDVQQGYCLLVDFGEGRLALELARQSELHVVELVSDEAKAAQARNMLAEAGFYGHRVSILDGPLHAAKFPKYFADLIVSEKKMDAETRTDGDRLLARFQRPNGGALCLVEEGRCHIEHRGPLPGAGQWTHQNSNPANTLCSDDSLVRGPLEMAWFRDGVIEISDRHAQGPAPLFNNGILVVEGVHGLCGLDAYNGRTRWTYAIDDILADWDGVHHDVGIGDTGSNLCLSDNSVFVRNGRSCLKIDLKTGRKTAEFTTPVEDDSRHRNWGFVAYANGLLFGSVLNDEHKVSPRYPDIRLRTESVMFFVLDAKTGDVCWKYEPKNSIRNNTIAIVDGRVFLIDRPIPLPDRMEQPSANGKHRPPLASGEHAEGTLLALNASDGQVVWTSDQGVWGTQLAASSDTRTLLMCYQGVKHSFFRLPSEVGGRLAAFDMDSGKKLWDRPATYKTRPVINESVIYAEGGAWDLKTGEEMPWTFNRSYGCGQIAASRHLMLFRSATLGYLDLTRDVGTENFGGIRPSCWFNAIPAGGMVLVPDGSAKCACSYQMRAWLALQPRSLDIGVSPH